MTEQACREKSRGSLCADMAVGDNGVAWLDAGIAKLLCQVIDINLGAATDDIGKGDVDCPRNMSSFVERTIHPLVECGCARVNEFVARSLRDRADHIGVRDYVLGWLIGELAGRERLQFMGRGLATLR